MPKTYYDSELTGAQIDEALEAIHGVVTPSNNGKVLCIVNGAISAKSASEWGHGAVLEPLSVTANGDYTPPSGTDGFDEVHVAVPSATLTTKSITQNGTYNASSDNADGYSSVTVNVSGGGGAVVQPLSVTQNGTYNPPSGVDGYAPVTVNVSGGGGGGGSCVAILEAMQTARAATNNDECYRAIGSVFYSHSIGDKFICNGRYFERDTDEPVLVTYETATGANYWFYVVYSKINTISGIYNEYGGPVSPSSTTEHTTQAGTRYYRIPIGSPWGGGAGSYNVTIKNGNSTKAVLIKNELLTSTNATFISAKQDFIETLIDGLF